MWLVLPGHLAESEPALVHDEGLRQSQQSANVLSPRAPPRGQTQLEHPFDILPNAMRIGLGILIAGGMILAGNATAAPSYRDFEGLQIDKLEIRGAPSDLEKELEKGLSLAEPAKLLRSRSSQFRAKALEEDRQRTRLFLAQRGYPRAEVTAQVKSAKGRKVNVTFLVHAGRPVTVESFVLEGVPPKLEQKAMKALARERGEILADAKIAQTARQIESKLRDQGYAQARVTPQITAIDSFRVQVRLVATTGNPYLFGVTRVTGVT